MTNIAGALVPWLNVNRMSHWDRNLLLSLSSRLVVNVERGDHGEKPDWSLNLLAPIPSHSPSQPLRLGNLKQLKYLSLQDNYLCNMSLAREKMLQNHKLKSSSMLKPWIYILARLGPARPIVWVLSSMKYMKDATILFGICVKRNKTRAFCVLLMETIMSQRASRHTHSASTFSIRRRRRRLLPNSTTEPAHSATTEKPKCWA